MSKYSCIANIVAGDVQSTIWSIHPKGIGQMVWDQVWSATGYNLRYKTLDRFRLEFASNMSTIYRPVQRYYFNNIIQKEL